VRRRARLPGYLARWQAKHGRRPRTPLRTHGADAPDLVAAVEHAALAGLVRDRVHEARMRRFDLWIGDGCSWVPTPAEVLAWLAADAEGAIVHPGEDPAEALARHRDPIGYRVREQERRNAEHALRNLGRYAGLAGGLLAGFAPVLRGAWPRRTP
jgi:hypothetical protein